jgi:hypothetical protein
MRLDQPIIENASIEEQSNYGIIAEDLESEDSSKLKLGSNSSQEAINNIRRHNSSSNRDVLASNSASELKLSREVLAPHSASERKLSLDTGARLSYATLNDDEKAKSP